MSRVTMKPRLFFVLILCTAEIFATKKYKIKLISMDRCKIPEDKVDKSQTVVYATKVRKISRQTTLISTNITVKKSVGPLLLNLKLYQLNQVASKDLVFKLDRVDCHNQFTYQMFKVINLKLDTNCIVAPGFYKTADINLQHFAWVLTKVMVTPGRYIYSYEAYIDKGRVLACDTFTCDIAETK